ncbi:hypothetical protein [Priestia endophytica]
MSKRKRTSKIDKWIKEGRCYGIGADYMPWLKIQDYDGFREISAQHIEEIGRESEETI